MSARAAWPLLLLGGAAAVFALLLLTRPEVERREPEARPPLVRVVRAEPTDVTLSVRAHGTVVPRTESDLVAEVAGEVVWVSPHLVAGGFFAAGEPLLRIDRTDYELELEAARAELLRAESEHARARLALERQERLRERGAASQARLDDAVRAERVAAAQLRVARARLARARRDLERTEVRAPYTGRVRSESVDPGQWVGRGTRLARVYAVDYAEVRLPVPDRELAFLDLPPLRPEAAGGPERGPEVLLRARFAGRLVEARGRVVRTEGEIDPRTRMVHLVARVRDPYGLEEGGREIPLAVGLFVEASVTGRRLTSVIPLPVAALRGEDRVLVVDEDSRLRFREVEVVRREAERVLVGAGLEAGERVAISPLRAVVDGMAVRVAEEGAVAAGDPPAAGRP